LIALLAIGCGDPPMPPAAADAPAGPPPAIPTGEVVLGLAAEPDSLNPYLATRSVTRDVAYSLYSTLIEEQDDFRDGPPSFRPALARWWEVSADGLTVTFHLHPDASWSDGEPLTAADVRFSWQAAIHPDVAWLAADVKQDIRDVEVVDDHTVRFRFLRRSPYQLMDANDGVILPRHVWSAIPFTEWRQAPAARDPIVSGPFRLARWQPGQLLELVPNPSHYDPARPRLASVAFRIMPDPVAGLEQLLAGQLDFWDRIDPRQADRVRAAPGVTLRRYPDRYYGFIAWNCSREPFRSAEVRRAMTLALDRERIADTVLPGTARVASGPIPPALGDRLAARSPLPHDPAAAAALLDAAGWRDGDGDGIRERSGRPLAFDLIFNSDTPYREDIALLAQEDLAAIGVQVRPVRLERRTYGARGRDGDFDAFIGGWRLPTKLDLAPLFASRAATEGVNFGRFASDRLDAILEQAAAAPDRATALTALGEALDLLAAEQPCTFLYWQDRLVGLSRRIRGARPNAQSSLDRLADWWVTGPAPGR
jgi:peptide/nickel transport system substrate-binding protein